MLGFLATELTDFDAAKPLFGIRIIMRFVLHVHLAWVSWVQYGFFQSKAKDNVLAIVLREGEDNLRFEPHLLWKLGP